MALFESYERREKQILAKLAEYGINSIEEAAEVTKAAGLDVYKMIEGIQPICFENAKWAYTVGAAIAIKKGCRKASEAAAAIGEGLQSFCIPGSVADQRKVGLGHGNLGKMLLEEDTECFAFLAGHESFAAAEGAIGIAEKANKVRQKPLRVILNGLGKDAAQIIARINGFTYVETEYDYYTGELKEVFFTSFDTLFFVGTCNWMLETSRVGGVSGDGNVNVLFPHDSNTFANIVSAVAVNFRTRAVGVCFSVYFFQLAGVVVILGLYISKAVDTCDDLSSVFSRPFRITRRGF